MSSSSQLGSTCAGCHIAGAQDVVVNPKVNNMLNAYENAKYPLFMISDAGIKGQCTDCSVIRARSIVMNLI